jgi:hypothetical protein
MTCPRFDTMTPDSGLHRGLLSGRTRAAPNPGFDTPHMRNAPILNVNKTLTPPRRSWPFCNTASKRPHCPALRRPERLIGKGAWVW